MGISGFVVRMAAFGSRSASSKEAAEQAFDTMRKSEK